ncbi:MAG: hypothetical protein HYZ14_10630 [Bacteroidetes bacterium]|nr:hypothetical protein [Bacteroidota bacterium]
MFRPLLTSLLIPAVLLIHTAAVGSEIETCIVQAKNNYLTIQFPKYDEAQLDDLMDELRSHESKVTDVYFNPSNHYLTVYYVPGFALDDVLYIISKYAIDYLKISGTEL